MSEAFLDVRDLRVQFPTEDGVVSAVDGVDFSVEKGKTLAIVGESGSGKSVTSQAIMGLINRKTAKMTGEVYLDGEELVGARPEQVRSLRGKRMAMIFQDPLSSLHPFYTIGKQLAEAVLVHQKVSKQEAYGQAREMLGRVGIPNPERRVKDYPHNLSGGMRQRVMIAMALLNSPELLIADEPTTALDVTVQAQIIELLRRPAVRVRHRHRPDHPRPRRRRRHGRRRRRDVRRPGRRARRRRRHLLPPADAVHLGPARLGAADGRRPRRAAGADPRPAAVADPAARRAASSARGARTTSSFPATGATPSGRTSSRSRRSTRCAATSNRPSAREIAAERLSARGGNVPGGGADSDGLGATRTATAPGRLRADRAGDSDHGPGPGGPVEAGGRAVTVVDETGASEVLRRDDALLRVDQVQKYFPITGGGVLKRKVGDVKAVESISFDIVPGETLGIVGESGCGKSTAGRTVMKLLDPTGGKIEFEGRDITNLTRKEMVPLRREMQMIFQDPYSSLNPRHTVGAIISAPFKVQGVKPARGVQAEVQDLMARVGLNPEHYNRYPNEFSGGQRQRIGIARAIALRPKLIVCDEPVSALDVSIQAQVVNLLEDLQDEFRLAYVFIAHDLSVVRHISDRIAVMYLGRIMEIADAEKIYESPAAPVHPRADLGGAAAGPASRAQARADPAQGRPAQPDQPAVRLRVPHPVPQGPGPLRRGDPAAARARPRPLRRLPLPRRPR